MPIAPDTTLTRAPDLVRALDGCRRMYFGLGVASYYLEATTTMAVTLSPTP